MKIFYLCDGSAPNCPRTNCYKRGGDCYHTDNVDHAKMFYADFAVERDGEEDYYWERRKLSFWKEFKRIFQG